MTGGVLAFFSLGESMTESLIRRRRFLQGVGAAALALLLPPPVAATRAPHLRTIPSSGERIPAIGMGSWISFDIGDDHRELAGRTEVLRHFLNGGGRLIDSSPMYGSSEENIGRCLRRLEHPDRPFAATKVWTLGQWLGKRQMEASRELWGVERFELMQIHNLLDWEAHMETLKAWKAEGRIRYLGVTTSHGRRHAELERIMASEPLDFVQLTYNAVDREAEARLLPLAAERGIAVIANRPFQGGGMLERLAGEPLPGWAAEIGCSAWSQLALKFILGHPAITCAIPATTRADHMIENMQALYGPLPEPAMREELTRRVANR